MPIKFTARHLKPKPIKIFRNPIIYARELRDRMAAEGINRGREEQSPVVSSDETTGDAATSCFVGCGGLGVSRARVTQWLELLEPPEKKQRRIVALGDHWDRRVMTEREMRGWRHRHIDLL